MRATVKAARAFALLLISMSLTAKAADTQPWMNSALSPDARADLVIAQMTLDEKIQMVHGTGWGVLKGERVPSRSNLGAGFVPANLHTQAIDGAIKVEAGAAKDFARRAATEEGILVGISSGATLAAIKQKLADLPANVRVLGFNYDTGERYLSVPDFLPES